MTRCDRFLDVETTSIHTGIRMIWIIYELMKWFQTFWASWFYVNGNITRSWWVKSKSTSAFDWDFRIKIKTCGEAWKFPDFSFRISLKAFNTISGSIQNHYQAILNYFDNRSINASAESFNAKLKAFESQFRGVRNIEFFLYRLKQIYA